MKKYVFIALLLLTVMPIDAQRRQKSEDAEQLGRAMEYFSSGKYHEALLLFQKLDDEYELNPRFKAYLERSFYYFADAESHFNLGHYRKCIPLYEKQLQVCYDNEKGDSFYRIAFSYMFLEEWENARDSFQSALSYYQRYRNTPELKARITQIQKMLPGIEEEVKKRASDN